MEPVSLAHQGGFGCGEGVGWIYRVERLWGASPVWVDSDQLNPMCFKQASLKQEK